MRQGEVSWVHTTGDPATIRFHVSAEELPAIISIDIHRYDGIFISAINNLDTHRADLPLSRGEHVIELYIRVSNCRSTSTTFRSKPTRKTARPTGTIRRTFTIKCINSTSSPTASSTGSSSSKPNGERSIIMHKRLRSHFDGRSLR